MCDFCKNIRDYYNDADWESPCIVSKDGQTMVYFNGLYAEFYEIHFCPICGRKLDEEKELPWVEVK